MERKTISEPLGTYTKSMYNGKDRFAEHTVNWDRATLQQVADDLAAVELAYGATYTDIRLIISIAFEYDSPVIAFTGDRLETDDEMEARAARESGYKEAITLRERKEYERLKAKFKG